MRTGPSHQRPILRTSLLRSGDWSSLSDGEKMRRFRGGSAVEVCLDDSRFKGYDRTSELSRLRFRFWDHSLPIICFLLHDSAVSQNGAPRRLVASQLGKKTYPDIHNNGRDMRSKSHSQICTCDSGCSKGTVEWIQVSINTGKGVFRATKWSRDCLQYGIGCLSFLKSSSAPPPRPRSWNCSYCHFQIRNADALGV